MKTDPGVVMTRLEIPVKEALRAQAEKNGRSLSKELARILTEYTNKKKLL